MSAAVRVPMPAAFDSHQVRAAMALAGSMGYAVKWVEFITGAPSAAPLAGLCDKRERTITVAVRVVMAIVPRDDWANAVLAILMHEIQHAQGASVADAIPRYGLICGGTL